MATEEYRCEICLGTCPVSEATLTLSCGHHYCKDCYVNYLASLVRVGEVKFCCFHEVKDRENSSRDMNTEVDSNNRRSSNKCGREITKEEVESILSGDSDSLEIYRRFYALKSSNYARECVKCKYIDVFEDSQLPIVSCSSCGEKYCFYHANAHLDTESCESYENRTSEANKASELVISKTAKKCPKCSMPIEKIGGCNHMKCSHCSQSFCWVCGKAIDDDTFPAHFQWWNMSGCSNLQMDDDIEPSAWTRRLAKITSYLEIAILGPLSLLSTVVSTILCPCCVYAMSNKDNNSCKQRAIDVFQGCMTGWGMFWIMMLVMLPSCLFVSVLFIAVAVIVYPCYAIGRMASGNYPWPDILTECCLACYTRMKPQVKYSPPPVDADGDIEAAIGIGIDGSKGFDEKPEIDVNTKNIHSNSNNNNNDNNNNNNGCCETLSEIDELIQLEEQTQDSGEQSQSTELWNLNSEDSPINQML